jgi:hypothetical protein
MKLLVPNISPWYSGEQNMWRPIPSPCYELKQTEIRYQGGMFFNIFLIFEGLKGVVYVMTTDVSGLIKI